MNKNIKNLILILILGALGGMTFQAFILPYLATMPYFQRFDFIKILTQKEVIINQAPNEIIIEENTALQDAIEKVQKSVFGVRAESSQGKVVEGTALILTNDGYFVSLPAFLPKGYEFKFFLEGGAQPEFKTIKTSSQENLALAQLQTSDLSTTPFAETGSIRLGQRVFLVGFVFEKGVPKKVVNEGIVKSVSENSIETNIFESISLQGSPLFNIKGEIIGLSTIGKSGQVLAIPVDRIREFTGF